MNELSRTLHELDRAHQSGRLSGRDFEALTTVTLDVAMPTPEGRADLAEVMGEISAQLDGSKYQNR